MTHSPWLGEGDRDYSLPVVHAEPVDLSSGGFGVVPAAAVWAMGC